MNERVEQNTDKARWLNERINEINEPNGNELQQCKGRGRQLTSDWTKATNGREKWGWLAAARHEQERCIQRERERHGRKAVGNSTEWLCEMNSIKLI